MGFQPFQTPTLSTCFSIFSVVLDARGCTSKGAPCVKLHFGFGEGKNGSKTGCISDSGATVLAEPGGPTKNENTCSEMCGRGYAPARDPRPSRSLVLGNFCIAPPFLGPWTPVSAFQPLSFPNFCFSLARCSRHTPVSAFYSFFASDRICPTLSATIHPCHLALASKVKS